MKMQYIVFKTTYSIFLYYYKYSGGARGKLKTKNLTNVQGSDKLNELALYMPFTW